MKRTPRSNTNDIPRSSTAMKKQPERKRIGDTERGKERGDTRTGTVSCISLSLRKCDEPL